MDKIKQKIRGQQQYIKKRMLKEQGTPHCELCGNSKKEILQIHHIKPIADGGTNDDDNLIILCPNCHKLVHVGGISEKQLKAAKKNKNVFITPDKVQEKLNKLKQIETKLEKSILGQKELFFALNKANLSLPKEKYEQIQEIKAFEDTHKDIKTKVQLCTYLNRIELKYQALKDEYAKISLENKKLKTELENIKLPFENTETESEKDLSYFLRGVFKVLFKLS